MNHLRTVLRHSLRIATPLALLATWPAPLPVQAQPAVPASAVRAINLARTTAISQNGGLSRYRPAQCMFQTANSNNPCLIDGPDKNNNAANQRNNNGNNDNYVFRFQGGAPGWQQLGQAATVETEIAISPDGRQLVQIVYNGSPR